MNPNFRQLIDSIDLSKVAQKMVEHQGWTRSEVKNVERLYRNLLLLNLKYPEKNLPPSDDVDEFWHNHILDTRQYHADCERVFGHYLHHYPYFGLDGASSLQDAEAAFNEMQELHFEEFGYYSTFGRYRSWVRPIVKLSERIRDFLNRIRSK